MTSRIRAPVTNAEKLAVTLRYLASGQSMRDVSIQFRLGHTTTHKIIIEVCQAIWNGLAGRYVKCPSSPAEWAAVAQEFCQQWNFPNCLGAIDGKHINIQAPHNAGSSFYNYKNFHSIVLLAVVDAHCRFLVVDIGCSGRDSDGGIFASSNFGQALESATANVPQPSNSIPGLGTFPYCLVGRCGLSSSVVSNATVSRKAAIHGEEDFQLPLDCNFSVECSPKRMMSASLSIHM